MPQGENPVCCRFAPHGLAEEMAQLADKLRLLADEAGQPADADYVRTLADCVELAIPRH